MSLDELTAHGLTGGKKIPAPKVEVFTSSGTWNKDPKGVRFLIECWGAGGGGGKGSYRVGGGGGGSHAMRMMLAASLPGTVTVTVGAGGAPGTSTGSTFWVPGGTGGDSSFGAYVVGQGGGGGMATGDSTSLDNYEGLIQGAPGGIVTYQSYSGSQSPRGMVPRVNTIMDGHHLGGSGAGNQYIAGTNPFLNAARAGDSIFGGGGGGGSAGGRAGTSVYAGAGGTSVYDSGVGASVATDGIAPGGGGGAAGGTASPANPAGAGARGEVRVTTYYA